MKITGVSTAVLKELRTAIVANIRPDRRPKKETPDQEVLENFLSDQLKQLLIIHDTDKGKNAAHAAAVEKHKDRRI